MPQKIEDHPLKLTSGSTFGRYPKVSACQTFNMIVSDSALVPYAGYKNVVTTSTTQEGRGIYSSSVGNFMIEVFGTEVQVTESSGFPTHALTQTILSGALSSAVGPVYFAENNNEQILITDGIKIYVVDYSIGTFPVGGSVAEVVAAFITAPGYVTFQNGRFLVADTSNTNWYLSGFNNTTFVQDAQHTGAIQTKPDKAQAAIPIPGGGNNLLVLGRIVSELWQDVGNALFPYVRQSSYNIDYGCLNASSIAFMDEYIVWLSANDKAGPVVVVFSHNSVTPVSTDGIDFKLANLTNPSNCFGFLFRQDGHLIYQFTFPDDNLTYLYDFETKLFFTATDENLNYHIARQIAFFDDRYYFVSLNGGNVYQFSSDFTAYEYSPTFIKEIPRIVITGPLRLADQDRFVMPWLGFTIENGRPNLITTFTHGDDEGNVLATESLLDLACENGDTIGIEADLTVTNTYTYSSAAIDLSISRDGGENFGSAVRVDMNPVGYRSSRLSWERLGSANDACFKIQFWGFERFVAFDGIVKVYI